MSIRQYSRWCCKPFFHLLTCLANRLNRSRLIFYVTFFVLAFFLFFGQPNNFIKSHIHISWLANVKHVRPLQCLPNPKQSGWPRVVQPKIKYDTSHDYLTVVVVTARPEFNRLPATLAALTCHLDFRRIAEVIFLVPPGDVNLLQPFLSKNQTEYWPWPVSIFPDDKLLQHTHTISYRLQMIFKLFLAQIVQTEYYFILDSDCLAVWPIHVEHLLYKNRRSSTYKSLYQIEDKSGHAKWWSETEELLQTKLESCLTNGSSSSLPTMGVTPSILSRTIALKTLCRLQKLYGDAHFLNKMANWALWRLFFGRMWTEYTLYYLAARCTNLFDTYHFHYSTLSSVQAVNLYGFSIWSDIDWTKSNQNRLIETIHNGLKWRRKEVEEADGQALIDRSVDIHSLFSVLQGRHGVNPKLFHNLFYPIYMDYLKQQNQTDNLIGILDRMSDTLLRE